MRALVSSMIRALAAASPEMLEVFGDAALIRAALRFEAELAKAEASEGLIPDAAAVLIAAACEEPVDIVALATEAAFAGTLAIPLVAILRARVAKTDVAASKLVHRGGTSQDLADTALMLQVRLGAALIVRDTERLGAALASLTHHSIDTPMVGRTLLQAALPITLGLKTANWLLGIDAALTRFRRECDSAIALQFGGATGSLSGLDGKALAVAARLAKALELADPPLPWQARRDGIAGLATALAILTGAVGKIARDVALLAQSEVAEAFEPRQAGRGGSSAMAHKRNPTGCQIALSAALRAPHLAATILSGMAQEHERGLGGWQAESAVLAELFGLAHGALLAIAPVVEGLEIDQAAMRRNLDRTDVGQDIGESVALARRALDFYERER